MHHHKNSLYSNRITSDITTRRNRFFQGEIRLASLFHCATRSCFRASQIRLERFFLFSALGRARGGESSHFWFGVMGTRSQSDPTNSPTTVTPPPPPHKHTSCQLTTRGSIAVSAFETQPMLYNRGLISLIHPPNIHQHPHHSDQNPTGARRNVCLCSENVSLKCYMLSRNTGLT